MKLAIPNQYTKYAVGIDFGHGETSFAYCPFLWGNNAEVLLENPPIDIQVGNGIHTIPSVYSIDKENSDMYIGVAGVDYIQFSKGNFKISFKKRPSLMNTNEKEKYTEFMRQVHVFLCDKASDIIKPDEYVVYMCRPSGWGSEENQTDDELYLEMAYNAGIPVAGIWPESRAAMISNSLNKKVDFDLHSGNLLIDLGSSTIDLTYMDENMNFPIDDNGNDYGAQIVDIILYEYILSLPGNELAKKMVTEKDYLWVKDRLLFECRKQKELFFMNRNFFSVGFDLGNICSDDEEYFSGTFRCRAINGQNEIIYNLIENGLAYINKTIESSQDMPQIVCDAINTGYYSKLRTCIKEFIDKPEVHTINCIILTGGASFMFREQGFVTFRNKILRDILPNYDSISIFNDDKPSTTVSRGIACLGRSYAHFVGCEGYEGGESIIKRKIKEQTNVISGQKIQDDIASIITDRITDEVNLCFSRFKRGNTTTLQGLKSELEHRIRNFTNEVGETVNRNIEITKNIELNKAMTSISEITKLYTTKEPLLPDISAQIHLDKKITVKTDALDHAINALSASIGEWVIAGIFYVVFAIVCYPIYLISRLNPFGDTTKSFDEWFGDIDLDDDLITREMSESQRTKAYNKFKKKEKDTRSEIYSEVTAALNNNNFQTKVKSALSSVINQYRDESISVIKRIFK